jgi:hypothetical protein
MFSTIRAAIKPEPKPIGSLGDPESTGSALREHYCNTFSG